MLKRLSDKLASRAVTADRLRLREGWRIRKRRERERKRRLRGSLFYLSLQINPDSNALIDIAVRRGQLIERDVSEDPGKLQAVLAKLRTELNALKTTIEDNIANEIRNWRDRRR